MSMILASYTTACKRPAPVFHVQPDFQEPGSVAVSPPLLALLFPSSHPRRLLNAFDYLRLDVC